MALAAKPVALETRWRAVAPDLKSFIKRLTASLEAEEDGQGLRQRRRKVADQEKFARAVEAICCNFAAVALALGDEEASERGLAVRLGSYASGISAVYGAHFNRAVALMEGRGLLTLTRGYRHSRAGRTFSTIRPTPAYWRASPPLPKNWQALHLEEIRRPIIIGVDSGDDGDNNNNKRREEPPPDCSRNATAEIEAINEHLKGIALGCGGRAFFVAHMENKPAIFLTTPQHRTVHRVFKGSIERGGRLYAAYWETMPREDRFRLLTISNEPVVNVDFGQLFLRLAYALEGKAPPPGDLYALGGSGGATNQEETEWQARREGVKRLVNALFSAKRALKQWPGGTNAERKELRGRFLPGTKPSDVVRAIKEKHSAIAAEWFEKRRGLELHRLESDILIAVMLRLIGLGIRGALPLHDSVIVARSDGETARRVMLEEALRFTGAEIAYFAKTGQQFR